jgi:hypothetical protein
MNEAQPWPTRQRALVSRQTQQAWQSQREDGEGNARVHEHECLLQERVRGARRGTRR